MDLSRRLDIKNIDKFDCTSYQQWKHGLLMELEMVELLDIGEAYEQCPDEIFANDANFEDAINYPIPTNIGALKDWRKKDCIARTMIYHSNDKERQKEERKIKRRKPERNTTGHSNEDGAFIGHKVLRLKITMILTDKTTTEGRLRKIADLESAKRLATIHPQPKDTEQT
ncbi:hypothetical protein GHT06_019019 [Daphnia sinensis]|uniref:Uncharacterized protein n=1 Tax=Daphnia sinensis TaxID=1820382 RepID=A0AAD5KJG9_9CRUS|nr:hypothetical protein GHT06_019019 [Daphnia sinensis]